MKFSFSHRLKTPLAIAIGVGIILVTTITVVALKKANVSDTTKSPSGAATSEKGPTKDQAEEQARVDAQNKQDFLDNQAKQSSSSNDGSSSSTGGSASLTVTASQAGSSVTVLTQIKNVTAGNCSLVAVNGQKQTTQSAAVLFQPEFSSCAGFSIPTADLGAGNWNITVTVKSDLGDTLSKTASLEVN